MDGILLMLGGWRVGAEAGCYAGEIAAARAPRNDNLLDCEYLPSGVRITWMHRMDGILLMLGEWRVGAEAGCHAGEIAAARAPRNDNLLDSGSRPE